MYFLCAKSKFYLKFSVRNATGIVNAVCREINFLQGIVWGECVCISISVPSQIFNPRHAVTGDPSRPSSLPPTTNPGLPKASQVLMERGRKWGEEGAEAVYEVRYGSAAAAWPTLKKLPPKATC